ncbi:MAG: hypothetical protein WCS97_00545 [Candidatus Paceibacterota bacterium]|jgi:hypothetical protein
MKPKTSVTPFLIAILIAAAFSYWYFFTGTEQPSLIVSGSSNQAQTKFQTLVGELKSISFDTGIFSDSRFNALIDFTISIAPEASGRLDPFAPISGISEI